MASESNRALTVCEPIVEDFEEGMNEEYPHVHFQQNHQNITYQQQVNINQDDGGRVNELASRVGGMAQAVDGRFGQVAAAMGSVHENLHGIKEEAKDAAAVALQAKKYAEQMGTYQEVKYQDVLKRMEKLQKVICGLSQELHASDGYMAKMMEVSRKETDAMIEECRQELVYDFIDQRKSINAL